VGGFGCGRLGGAADLFPVGGVGGVVFSGEGESDRGLESGCLGSVDPLTFFEFLAAFELLAKLAKLATSELLEHSQA
jgi:hypothetical protein